MSVDPAVKALLEARRKVLPRTGTVSAQEMRAIHQALLGRAVPGPELYAVEDVRCPTPEGGIATRLYRPTREAKVLIVYFHGGGYTVGSLDGWDATLRRMARETNCSIVSVDYRLAPEYPFPAAVDDALAAVRWAGNNRQALSEGARHLIVAGDSAGAALATVAAMLVRDQGGPLIAAQVLLYPGVDGDINSEFMQRFVPPSLTREEIAWYYDQYIPDLSQRRDPRFAPLHASDLSRLPPAFVGTVQNDLFREEGDLYAQRLRQVGVEVVSKCYEGTFHGFLTADQGLLHYSGDAISDIGHFIENLVLG